MSLARNLSNSARVTLGTLAAKSTVVTADLADSAVTTAKLAADSVTAAKLGTNEKRQIVRAFGYINGTTGALVSGFGLTSSRTSAGNYAITLSSAAPDTNFTVVATAAQSGNQVVTEASDVSRSTTSVAIRVRQTATGTIADVPFFSIAILW